MDEMTLKEEIQFIQSLYNLSLKEEEVK